MRGRSGVANRRIAEGYCVTVNAVVIGVKALSQSVPRDTASVASHSGWNAVRPAGQSQRSLVNSVVLVM